MRWLRRRRRFSLGRYVPQPSGRQATIDEIVDDGVLISGAAVRLAVKNRVILAAVRDRDDYSSERTQAAVRDELQALAREKASDADWAERQSAAAALRPGQAEHHSDFRAIDRHTLDRRRDVSRSLSDRLLELTEDERFVVEMSERARADAWEEIAASITVLAALSSEDPPDEAYTRERGERLMGLLDDIAQLDAESTTAPKP